MELPPFISLYSLVSLYLAVVLDLSLGDGNYSFHPVRIMGALISFSEKRFRASGLHLKVAGCVMAIVLVGGTFFFISFLINFMEQWSIWEGIFLSSLVIYFCLSLRCLGDEAIKVFRLLSRGKLNEARKQLSFLVSRDTKDMDVADISRSSIETVAENFVDGVISPFFYAFIFGPAMAMAFKMASTLDSMIGYKTDEFKDLGFFSAKLDDFLNFIPARLCLFFIFLAGLLFHKKNPFVLFKEAKKYFTMSESPNSGYPEAAFAVVLGVRLGGPTKYHGSLKYLPHINEDGERPAPIHIKKSVILMYQSSLLFYLVPIFLYIFIALTF